MRGFYELFESQMSRTARITGEEYKHVKLHQIKHITNRVKGQTSDLTYCQTNHVTGECGASASYPPRILYNSKITASLKFDFLP